MAKKTPKKTTERKRRGSAAGVKPRAKRAAVQPSLPGVPDGRIAKLEELDAELAEAKRERNACNTNIAAIDKRMVEEVEKSGRESYRTSSGYVVRVITTKKVKRTPVPKAPKKPRKAAA
jgi:hypothetical protein